MTESQKRLRELVDRQSHDRQKAIELSRVDTLDDAQRAELDTVETRAADTERQLRAARVAVEAEDEKTKTETRAEPDAEHRARVELRGRSRLGSYIAAALQGRQVVGAEAEFSAASGVPAGHIPLDLFEADRPEVRVDAATVSPTTGLGATLAPIQPFVFSESIAPRLGIAMPQVGSGAYSEATITMSLTAAAKVKGVAQDSTAAVLTTVTANPRRIAARLTIGMEDIAQIGVANFEAALRENATQKLSDEYDRACISGNGTAPNVNGLINQLTNPTDPTAITTFDGFVGAFVDQVEGLWAGTGKDVAIVTNADVWGLSGKTFRDRVIDTGQRGGVSLGDMSFSDYATAHFGGWWCNSRMPATASTIARGIVYRMGKPGLRTASHPTWGSISVTDIYSDAASGQTHFTLAVLVGDKVLIVQPSAYDLVEFKTS